MTLEQITNHDCHTSPDDGCSTCEKAKLDEVCIECDGEKEVAFDLGGGEVVYKPCLDCKDEEYTNEY